MRKIILAALAVSVIFTSCKKEKKETPAPAPVESKAEILKKHTWLQTALIEDNENIPLDDCEKDNEWKFSDNLFTLDYGPAKCDTFETSEQFNYFLSADYTKITFSEDGEAYIYTIDALDNTQFILSYSEEDYKITIKLKPKQ